MTEKFYYPLTKEEKDYLYSAKYWNVGEYEIKFDNGWVGGDSLIVHEKELDVIKNILNRNSRSFKITKNIQLVY